MPLAFIFALIVQIFVVSLAFYSGIVPHDYMLYKWIALPTFVIMILSLSKHNLRIEHGNRMISYLSGISFTFYLFQALPIWSASRKIYAIIGIDSTYLKFSISFLICLIGAIFYELFEKPLTKYLKQNIFS